MKTFQIVNNDISDGYHTFTELYDHRCLIFINLVLSLKDKSKATWKEDPEYGNWFCLYLETEAGQISYHIDSKYLYLIESKIKKDNNYKWDGHTSQTVVERLIESAESKRD